MCGKGDGKRRRRDLRLARDVRANRADGVDEARAGSRRSIGNRGAGVVEKSDLRAAKRDRRATVVAAGHMSQGGDESRIARQAHKFEDPGAAWGDVAGPAGCCSKTNWSAA